MKGEKKKEPPKGFSYHLEDEKIEAYKKLSTEDKLRWLEEIDEFTRLFQTRKAAKVREKFKRGEL